MSAMLRKRRSRPVSAPKEASRKGRTVRDCGAPVLPLQARLRSPWHRRWTAGFTLVADGWGSNRMFVALGCSASVHANGRPRLQHLGSTMQPTWAGSVQQYARVGAGPISSAVHPSLQMKGMIRLPIIQTDTCRMLVPDGQAERYGQALSGRCPGAPFSKEWGSGARP
jgi:hypothetical protein